MKTIHHKFKKRLVAKQLFVKLFLWLFVGAIPSLLMAQEMTQDAVSNGAGLVSGGNYTGYVSVGQMATYMYANGSYIATSGIILNEISGDVEFTFELSGNLVENENLKSGELHVKSGSTVLEGTPLAFTKVYLLDTETGDILFETETDGNGYFVFPNIPYQNFYFVVKTPEVPLEPVLLTFESNIFIKEVEINGEVGIEGISASVTVTPNNTCDPENPDYAIWYLDNDDDGFGTNTFSIGQCTQPKGYVLNDSDCDDSDANINPDASDIPGSGIDANCDGIYPCSSVESLTFTAPLDPVIISEEISISATFEGSSPLYATWEWGDETSTSGVISESIINGSHIYTSAGVYSVSLILTNNCQENTVYVFKYIVIYDPSSGFVTGSGLINSPAGASILYPNATGIASFGFVSKYDKKKLVPKGNTVFEFDAGNLEFKSNEYEWLVVAGSKAKFKGRGTVNSGGNYQFMISAIDGDIKLKGNPDLFRIKIWDEFTEEVIYDNEMNTGIDTDPSTSILEGSIVIHTPKTKSELITSIDARTANSDSFIKAYPNPTTGKVILDIQNDKLSDINVRILNIAGQKVFENMYLHGNQIEFDLTGNTDGIYLINVIIEDDFFVKKLILQNR